MIKEDRGTVVKGICKRVFNTAQLGISAKKGSENMCVWEVVVVVVMNSEKVEVGQ